MLYPVSILQVTRYDKVLFLSHFSHGKFNVKKDAVSTSKVIRKYFTRIFFFTEYDRKNTFLDIKCLCYVTL